MSDFLGKTIAFRELEKIKTAVNGLRANARKFYEQGFEALTDQYKAELHASFQKSTSRTALLDVTFDFAANAANAKAQLEKALNGEFSEILAKQIPGVQLNKGVLTHGIKRNTHLEVKLPYFSSILDHINKSIVEGNVVDAADGRLWVFTLEAEDTVKKKNSISKLSVALELTKNAGIRQFSKESFRYDYTLLLAKQKVHRPYLEEKLEPLANEYFKSEFDGIGKKDFGTYLTDLDKMTDTLQIGGSNNFGNVLTSLKLSLPGVVLAAWKKAPVEKKDDVYLKMSREIQRFLRHWIPISYIQDTEQYHQKKFIYPILVYSSLPLINKIKFSNGIPSITTGAVYDWDYLDETVRNAVVGKFCPQELGKILKRVQAELNAENDGFVIDYADSRIPSILGLQSDDRATSKRVFEQLIFREIQIIDGIVDTGRKFGKFLEAQKIEEAIELLAEFGAKITDAFNENIGGLFAGASLRPLSSLLLLEIAKVLDPDLLDSIRPSAMLDLYILKPTSQFTTDSFLKGIRPANEELAIHHSIVSVDSLSI